MEYKGYTARIEFDPDAGLLHGEVEGLRDVITFEATDVRELEKEFRTSVDDYLEQCRELGEEPEKPYSGKFLIRVDPILHRDAAMAAARAGQSLNAFAADLLRRWVSNQSRRGGSGVAEQTNASDAYRGVPLFENETRAAAVAEDVPQAIPVWRSFTRNTPQQITPNTPSVINTPASALKTAGKRTRRKAA